MFTRRQFMRAAAASSTFLAGARRSYAFAQSPTYLSKFTQGLPGLGPTGISVASPNTARFPGTDYYRITMREFRQQVHPALGSTTFWGYADATAGSPVSRYLGPVIVAKKGRPVRITYTNELPQFHPLPVDRSIMGAEAGEAENRVVPHIHGGLVPWQSDGGPLAWFTPNPIANDPHTHGPDWNPGDFHYPNEQSARLLWYHDHALGITRLNAYAGLASAYIIRDDFEELLIRTGLLPGGPFEVPLIIQDKTFQPSGALWYPSVYEKNSQTPLGSGRWDYGPDQTPPGAVTGPLPVPSVVPEFFADTILVNGAAYPYLEVQPKRYRFRILNGSNARFYNLQLYREGLPGEADLTRPGPAMVQIGTEGGFLTYPVVLNKPPRQIAFDTNPASPTFGNATRYNLLLAPGERADVIIDFSDLQTGDRLILYSDAPSPFPSGDDRSDYYTGDPDQTSVGGAPPTAPGFGPNTRTLLQFRVIPAAGLAAPVSAAPFQTWLTAIGSQLASLGSAPGASFRTRDLTLNEDFDQLGRLIQVMGTNVRNGTNSQGLPTFGRAFEDRATETPRAGDVEIWRIFNLTGDTHPIHFHLVNVQVLGRQPFDSENYNGTPQFTGRFRGPDLNEIGPKETVRMNPNEMTVVLMKFDVPRGSTPSARTGGFNYVWHCHILEHEEHDMMRPLIVRP